MVSAAIVDHFDELLGRLLPWCLHCRSLGQLHIRHHELDDILFGERGHLLVLYGSVSALHAGGQVLVAAFSQGLYALIVLDAWVGKRG